MREKTVDVAEKDATATGSPRIKPQNGSPIINFKPEADLERVPRMARGDTESIKFGGEEEDPTIGVSFQRSSSPATVHKPKGVTYEKVGESGIKRMHKFSLYETHSRYYIIGSDIMDKQYRVLKIDRTAPPGVLNIFEDDILYNMREMNQLLLTIDDGNKAHGGMKLKLGFWGLLGFVRFTDAYYMILISKRSQVAMLGGHYVYQVDGTEVIPLTIGSISRFQKDRNPEETRLLTILNNMDLTRGFYYSYSYNITRSLQQNIIHERTALNENIGNAGRDFQDMFVWNNHLLDPARTVLKNVYDWCQPTIHGYITQASLDVLGRKIFITIIARRSRHFAGARFLKRGTNDEGYVANDVESEQIVSEALTTSFHAAGPRLYSNPTYTSYVQHRGSIPLYWTQDNTGVSPKPDIDMSLVDPFYSAAAIHFDNLFERYGSPIYVLNLIKARERNPRESKLLHAYKHCIDYLNQSLPQEHKLLYEAFDMSRAAKTRGQDVIGTLERIAEKVLQKTGFFQNGDEEFNTPQVQNGVARTNCIDCLDRTNAAQFVIGKRALGRQLQALGVISGNTVEYDSDCVEMFTQMFHGHGDAIAIQYGGSHLVNTMATYRKINQWQSSSRDMMESFKRYYHNSFLDSQRQEAYNLFLGNYIFDPTQPMLWDLTTDYYLHHSDPRSLLEKPRRDYNHWYTPSNLRKRILPPATMPSRVQIGSLDVGISAHDDYWLEYYRPLAISSFLKVFAFRLSNLPPHHGRDWSHYVFPSCEEDISPFVPRKKAHEHEVQRKNLKKEKATRKGVTILDPSSEADARLGNMIAQRRHYAHVGIPEVHSPVKHSILRDSHYETNMAPSTPVAYNSMYSLANSTSTSAGLSSTLNNGFRPADKALINQWTLTQFYENSMNPSVSAAEEDEYARYIEHPLNLPLVVSTEMPSSDDPSAMAFYEYLCITEGDGHAATDPHPHPHSNDPDNPDDQDNPDVRLAPSDLPRLDTDVTSLYSLQSHARPTTSHSVSTPFSHAPSYSYPYPYSHSPHPHLETSFLDGIGVGVTPTPHSHSHPYSHPSPPGNANFHTHTHTHPHTHTTKEDMDAFQEFLKVKDNPLDVLDEDGTAKRYKAYRQWLRGKSFFKQSKVDPEWQNQLPVR